MALSFRGIQEPALNKINTQKPLFSANAVANSIPIQQAVSDTVSFGNQVPPLKLVKGKNTTRVITFSGLGQPHPPALQMRVRGVTNHQKKTDPNQLYEPVDHNINNLANSDWQDGQPVEFELDHAKKRINLSIPPHGAVGRVPDEISKNIYSLIKSDPNQYRFELSNVIAGTTKGADTIGLRVNLIHTGNKSSDQQHAQQVFNEVLNDPEAKEKVMLYQPKTSPEEALRLILNHENKLHGPAAKAKMEEAIETITNHLKNPENKRILLIGHCKPDGDTLGCISGMKQVIHLMDPTRSVDCAIDDKIPGLFRNKLPGMEDVLFPVNPEKIDELTDEAATLKKELKQKLSADDREAKEDQLKLIEQEIKHLSDPKNKLDPDATYDLVITMDIPTPKRFTDKFKSYFDRAKHSIYIDHHPHRFDEWEEAKNWTGLDMAEAHEKGNVWVADKVPACAEMASIMADLLLPDEFEKMANGESPESVLGSKENAERLNTTVAGLVTGMSTDTGSFTRTANLTPDDMHKPVQERPDFRPEGLAKWLMALTKGKITKKWLREQITYDIPQGKRKILNETFASARDTMLMHALDGRTVKPGLGLGTIQVDYSQMNDVWQAALEVDPEVTLLDVQNGFKYSELMGTFQQDPSKVPPAGDADSTSLSGRAKQNYTGPYDHDRIAVLICQDKQAGELNEKIEKEEQNGLRLSFRSADGSRHARVLAQLFGGGGHGGAAGGRVDLPGVTLESKLSAVIDGKKVTDNAEILKALLHNDDITNSRMSEEEKTAQRVSIELVLDDAGKTTQTWLEDITTEIRKGQPTKEQASENNKTDKADGGKQKGKSKKNKKKRGPGRYSNNGRR